ncbi:MAG TPA: SgcJ/EcaC family oxidoreductase [Thermoanaerobaculia bacterium]|nr:SgcJ/EcaC family oxidoreductase [Thermoanaerobaculia bacterium]HQR67215.1 SgcJ/EcaC family oxidoreductase [Thermoanaerobaculia bacterium]
MKHVTRIALFLCLALAASPVLAAEPAAPKHGLTTVDSAWVKAMRANDAAACAALYADDAVLVLPGSGAIKGKKAIAEAYAGWLKDVKVTDAAVMDSHYRSAGKVSAGWGAWKVTTVPKAGGAPTTETGTWCAVAVEKDGVWKYASDHAAADPPPAKK